MRGGSQTDRETRETDRQTDRHTGTPDTQAHRYTDRQSDSATIMRVTALTFRKKHSCR